LAADSVRPLVGDKLLIEGAWRMIPLLTPIAPDMQTTVVYTGAVAL
jgi:hypothetical protein